MRCNLLRFADLLKVVPEDPREQFACRVTRGCEHVLELLNGSDHRVIAVEDDLVVVLPDDLLDHVVIDQNPVLASGSPLTQTSTFQRWPWRFAHFPL